MTDLDLLYSPAFELARAIRNKSPSPVELMQACLARIDDINEKLNCFCFVFHDGAMELAAQAEKAVAANADTGSLDPSGMTLIW